MLKMEIFPTDVLDTGDGYLVIMDIPGVKPENVEITGDDKSITIKGIKRALKSKNYLQIERFSGKFSRKILFPYAINISKAVADIENGVLYIRVPKAKNEFIIDTTIKIKITGGNI